VNKVHGKIPPTRVTRLPIPDISPKWVNGLLNHFCYPMEKFCISQNVLNSPTANKVQFQNFSQGHPPDLQSDWKGKGVERDKGREHRSAIRKKRERIIGITHHLVWLKSLSV